MQNSADSVESPLVKQCKKTNRAKPSEGLVFSDNRLGLLEWDPAPDGNCGIAEN